MYTIIVANTKRELVALKLIANIIVIVIFLVFLNLESSSSFAKQFVHFSKQFVQIAKHH